MTTHRNVARLPTTAAAGLLTATVLGGQDGRWLVDTGAGALSVGLAFSCHTRPAVGDQVLLAQGGGAGHILAVLERPGEQDLTLAFPAGVRLEASRGPLALAGRELGLYAGRQVELAAPELALNVAQARAQVGEGELTGRRWTLRSERLQVFADAAEQVVGRLAQRLGHCFRWVQELDQTRAGNAMYHAQSLFSIRSRDAVVTAEKDMKLDAERIHMG